MALFPTPNIYVVDLAIHLGITTKCDEIMAKTMEISEGSMKEILG